jgi:peptidase M28-like protein
VVDLGLYRAAFLPALAAIGALLFSLQSLPQPLEPLVSPGTFDGQAAARSARQVAALAPSRPPGSEGDMSAADLVQRTFRTVRGGDVLEQTFSSGGTSMKNVILRLPGRSDRVVAVLASRDSTTGPGAATSAAATGALMEMAVELGGVTHGATILLASTDGGTAGEAGAKELASGFLDGADVEGVVALEAPGLENPRPPYLIDTADGPQRGGSQLERTAERALADQAGAYVTRPGAMQQLVRLAIPWGLGPQAPLIARGIDAVTISAGGELPVPAGAAETLSPTTLTRFARAALDVVLSLDSAPTVDHGPASYIEVGGNIVPGWAIRVLALALILPALVAAVDALARAARQGDALTALRWAAPKALPVVAALALV